MKSVLTLVFSLCVYVGADQTKDKYKVVASNGRIENLRTNSFLKMNDVLYLTDSLIFREEKSKAYVINLADKHLIQSRRTNNAMALADILKQSNPYTNFNYKGMDFVTRADVKTYFEASIVSGKPNGFLIVDTARVPIPSKLYNQDNVESFFVMKYNIGNQKINKKLEAQNDALILNDEIFEVDGEPIERDKVQNGVIYHYDLKANKKTYIGKFRPIVKSKSELMEELKIIASESGETNQDSLYKNYIRDYIWEFYGYVEEDQIMELLGTMNQ